MSGQTFRNLPTNQERPACIFISIPLNVNCPFSIHTSHLSRWWSCLFYAVCQNSEPFPLLRKSTIANLEQHCSIEEVILSESEAVFCFYNAGVKYSFWSSAHGKRAASFSRQSIYLGLMLLLRFSLHLDLLVALATNPTDSQSTSKNESAVCIWLLFLLVLIFSRLHFFIVSSTVPHYTVCVCVCMPVLLVWFCFPAHNLVIFSWFDFGE